MRFIKKYNRLFLFLFLLLFSLFFILISQYSWDATWEYGMSHAIRNGLLPYKDFNTVNTPLFIFCFSIGLFINDSFFMFLFELLIMYFIMFCFLDKMLKSNSILIIIAIEIVLLLPFVPSYNTFSFILLVLLICFEKFNYSDYLIGFFLGLLILSKHTIGLSVTLLLMVGLIVNRSWNKIGKRLLSLSIPLIIFFIYLIISGSLSSFLDLCVLGLFDFGSNNKIFSSLTFIMFFLVIINLFLLFKNKNNLLFYYTLGAISFCVPIVDLSHFCFYFIICLIPIIDLYGERIHIKYSGYVFFVILLIFNLFIRYETYDNLVFPKYNHFNYTLTNKYFANNIVLLNEKLSKYDNYYIIDTLSMYYDIAYDRDINYFDVPLYGNFGYDGTNKMMYLLSQKHDCYFVIRKNDNYGCSQFIIEAVEYIENNLIRVDSIGNYYLYYKE